MSDRHDSPDAARLEVVNTGGGAEIRLFPPTTGPRTTTTEARATATDRSAGAYLRFDRLATVLAADGSAMKLPIDLPGSAGRGDGRRAGGSAIEVRGAAGGFEATASWRRDVSASFPIFEVELLVRHTGQAPLDAALRIGAELIGGGRPRFMIPALFYRENRLPGCRRIYPRWDYAGGDPAELVSDTWSFRGDRASVPAVFGWNGSFCAGLASDEQSPLGLAGLGFSGNQAGARIWLDFPYREEPVVFTGHPPASAAERRFHRWAPAEEVALRFQVYVGEPDPHAYNPFVRELYRRRQAANPLAPWMEPARAAALTADALYRWHYRADDEILYETIGFDRENAGDDSDRAAMHVAWVSGAPYAYALLTSGRRTKNEAHAAAAERVLDKIASGITPAGTFWGEWRVGKGWGAGWNANPRLVHARTLAEATLFMIRALKFERELARTHAAWERAVLSNLLFATAHQDVAGNYGAYYDTQTGEVAEWAGAAGILWIAALVEGASFFEDQRFRDSAIRAGNWYRQFVDDQFIYGAPEDVHLAPTSEDGYNAVIAYLLLHEADPDGGWLDVAARAADWMLTFRWTYNTTFPEHTILGHYDFRTRGGDQASTAIQILHPYGLICLPEMARLARHTGDNYYRERTRDNLACFLQFVAREDGDFDAWRGMVTERYYHTNAFQAKGMLLTLSHAWCVGVTLYACQEAAAYPEILPQAAVQKGVTGARSG